MSDNDTIAAIATAPGQGGIGIVRVSGPTARKICTSITGLSPEPRSATYARFQQEGEIIDEGIVILFEAPNSFTGEDVVEFQGHGGSAVMDRLLRSIIATGARQARAGEFSERAFLNDKIDLAQAEAIADLIEAESDQAASAAMRSLQGDFSKLIQGLVERLIRLRMHVESALDFPEEEIDFLDDDVIARELDAIISDVADVESSSRDGRLLREGIKVVITGRPNAGKSSLLNLLAGQDAAIVSDIPGTTRDVLREHIHLEGIPLHIIDTAGIRDSDDHIEREGVRRAEAEMAQADLILHIIDATMHNEEISDDDNRTIHVLNKIDLINGVDRENVDVAISVKQGTGIDELTATILQRIGYHSGAQGEGLFSARTRHLNAISESREHLDHAHSALHDSKAGEIMAEELRLAQQALSSITGEFAADDLLGRIFSEFCIGK